MNWYYLLALLALALPPVQAWEAIECRFPVNDGQLKHWKTPVFRPVLDPISIPPESEQYLSVLAAIEEMDANPSRFRFQFGGFDDGDGVGIGNGESEIWIADLGAKNSTASAMERSDADFARDCLATESDIIINSNYRLERPPAGTNKITSEHSKALLFQYGGSYSPLQTIVMHELAHSAGLHHEGDVLNLMGRDYLLVANGDNFQPYIGEDTASGLIARYGLSPNAKQEVSVSHWRYADKVDGGSYSFISVLHRTRIFSATGEELPMRCPYAKPDPNGPLITACPEPVYRVRPGDSVKLELTYENSGKAKSIQTTARYYLSEDNFIDNDDKPLLTRRLTLKREATPDTQTIDLTVPGGLQTGRNYWIGCIVDADNQLNESVENNNATYVGIWVE